MTLSELSSISQAIATDVEYKMAVRVVRVKDDGELPVSGWLTIDAAERFAAWRYAHETQGADYTIQQWTR